MTKITVDQLQKLSDEEKIELIKKDIKVFLFIENPSDCVCLEVIKHDGNAIQFIKNPSEQVKLAAKLRNGNGMGLEAIPRNRLKYWFKDKDFPLCDTLNSIKFIKE